MGNTIASGKPERVDLSLRALSQTSVDDKVWLGVTEDILFNDSLTNEKYYMLHSRPKGKDYDNYFAEDPERHIPNHYEEPGMSYYPNLDVIADSNEDSEYYQSTVGRLADSLYSGSSVKTAYYASYLQKRLSILKRIHLALNREKAREKLFDASYIAKAETRRKASTVPMVIRMSTRLFLTMLQEQAKHEPKVASSILQTLNGILRELPALSLSSEPADVLESFHSYLRSIITTTTTPETKQEALECIIGLALNQGSLTSILSALSLVLVPQDGSHNLFETHLVEKGLRMASYLKQLSNWKVDLALSPLSRDQLIATWPISWNDNISESSLSFMSSPSTVTSSITTDGSYIYLHDTCGLAKIGTGQQGTVQGRVYARVADWFPGEKGWLACVQDKLYYRSTSIEPASLVVIGTKNLEEEGRIFQDGTGSISSVNNMHLPFGPEKRNMMESGSVVSVPNKTYSRFPLLTDGRYLYIISLQRFQAHIGVRKFEVGIYDPQRDMEHVRSVELCYSDSDFYSSEASVLNPHCLEVSSFYTNGDYLMCVLPPPLGTDYGYDMKSYVCRSFSLSNGVLMGNYCLENQPLGVASCYDWVNNVVWNYSSLEAELGKYGNEGLAPKHNFPGVSPPSPKPHALPPSINNNNAHPHPTSSSSHVKKSSSSSSLMFSPTPQPRSVPAPTGEDKETMRAEHVVMSVLGIISRLAVDCMPSANESGGVGVGVSTSGGKGGVGLLKTKEPFCVEVELQTFISLHSILSFVKAGIATRTAEHANGPDATKSKPVLDAYDMMWLIIHCLRILKVNMFRLASTLLNGSGKDIEKYKNQNFLSLLRDLLLGFIMEGVIGSDKMTSQLIQTEACEVLTAGFDLFYPTPLKKAQFVLDLLNEENSDKKPKGIQMLLGAVLNLLASHTSASFIALPPLPSEVGVLYNVSQEDDILIVSEVAKHEAGNFDPMRVFVPMITHLLRVAQANMGSATAQAIKFQDASPLSFSLYSSAPPPPLTNASPAMRLLLATQKDLIIRVERCVSGSNVPTLALVTYARQVIARCKDLLDKVLHEPASDVRKKRTFPAILLADVKGSVVGALLPTLIHSLFLFSGHTWLAHELLPSLIDLIHTVDRVNAKMPRMYSKSQQPFQKSHQKRSSFVEGPSRVCETLHPYHPNTSSKTVVTIPGALFLSLVFDERCCTASADDFLQLYEDIECKEPFGEKFCLDPSHWPRRRILVPGEQVVFHFVTSDYSQSSNSWGFRCSVIGHLPNSERDSLPWSSHVEKTMCCLSGQFAASLIRGEPISEFEQVHASLLESPLLEGGIEENYVSAMLNETPVGSVGFILSPSTLRAQVPEPARNANMPRATDPDPNIEAHFAATTADIQKFCEDLAHGVKTGEVGNFSAWMWETASTDMKQRQFETIRAAQQAVVAAWLKHEGLVLDAMRFAASISDTSIVKDPNKRSFEIRTNNIIPRLQEALSRVRGGIILRHQEQQLNTAIEEEINIATRRRSSEIRAHMIAKEASYKDIVAQVVSKSLFLLKLRSTAHDHHETQQQPENDDVKKDILTAVLKFVMMPGSVDDIRQLLLTKRSRALARAAGLRFMRSILASASDLQMKHETLVFLGPALRHKETFPYHYTDDLRGSGLAMLEVQRSFMELMGDVANILTDPGADAALKLQAVDSWCLSFRKTDHAFLSRVDIFNILHRLTVPLVEQESEGIDEEEFVERAKLSRVANKVFRFLGLTVIQEDNLTGKCNELQESFLTIVATQMENALAWLSYRQRGTSPPITGIRFPNLGQSQSPRFTPRGEFGYKPTDLTEVLALLLVLSRFPHARTRLCDNRFIYLFLELLRLGDSNQRRHTLRLLRRILPSVSPENCNVRNKPLLIHLMEFAGNIEYISCCPTAQLQVESIYEFLVPAKSPHASLNNLPTKMESPHPFFSYFDHRAVLPHGWDRNLLANRNIRLSPDFRTVSFIGGEDDSSRPYMIRSDHQIPDNIPLFYFEVRIENEGKDGTFAIGLHPADAPFLRSKPGVRHGFGYDGRDGCKLSYRSGPRKSTYGLSYGKNDIVGCGWNRVEGKVFFTKNGTYQGTAFKNVFGNFWPVVGLGSAGCSVMVNFGQTPFLYDDLKNQVLACKEKAQIDNAGHLALSFSSEIVLLLRHLMRSPKWKQPIVDQIAASLRVLPSLLVVPDDEPPAPPPLQQMPSSSSLPRSTTPPLIPLTQTRSATPPTPNSRASTPPIIPLIPMRSATPPVTPTNAPNQPYTHTNITPTVTPPQPNFTNLPPQYQNDMEDESLLMSGFGNYEDSVLACAALAILSGKIEGMRVGAKVEVDGEFGVVRKGVVCDYTPGAPTATLLLQNNPTRTIHPLKTIRLAPEPSIDYTQFSHLQVIVSTLTLFLKPVPIPPTYATLFYYMKARAMKVLDAVIATPECCKYMLESGKMATLVENALQTIPLDEEPKVTRLEWQAALLREKLFEATYKHLQLGDEYDQDELDDYDGEEHDEENGEGSEASSTISSEEKEAEVPAGALSPLSSGEEEAKEPDDEPTVSTGRVKWRDIRVGSAMMVARREKIGSTRSNWVANMDDAIGRVGIVKLLDKRHHQVLLQFYDADTASSSQWWFCYDILQFAENFTKSSLQIIHEAQLPQLIELDMATEMSLFTLYSREAVLNLLSNTPVYSFVALGGVKNLALILQLAINEPHQTVNHQERWPIFDNRVSPSVRLLQSKLATLLRMEEHSMRSVVNGSSRSQSMRVDTPPLMRKSGFLYKQNKLFKNWKRFWFVLQGGYLTEYKSMQNTNPISVIDLSDFISAEDITKKSKIFAKKDFTFQITTSRGTQLLQASSEEDRDDWIARLKDAASFAQANARSQMGPNLTDFLTREVIRHFRETATDVAPCLFEETKHPYQSQTKSKKVLRLENVESVVVVFDPQCCTTPGMDILRFFKNPACTELIASFSGRGPSAFPPLVIPSGQFWVTFSAESTTAEWGYKFSVHGIKRKLNDEQMMSRPSFDLAYTISDWLLDLDPSWAREFYSTATYDALLFHFDSNPPLHHKIKVLTCLTRLTQRYREFPVEGRPDLMKLDKYRKEMFELYAAEKATGECIHSVELQRLVEWITQVEIVEQYRRQNLTKEERDKERDREKERTRERTEFAWFYNCVKTAALMKQLIKGENFPREFIKEACMEDRKHICVEESPHPYPKGVRVTATVHMPNAQSLIITFDPRSSTEPNIDYLMFSRVAVGGDELGFFTGDFPTQPLVITGDRFIWSFFSDSSGSDWGFRFTVTPQFSEEITREMESQCEVDCEYLTNVGPEWTLAMDHELVKFVGSACDKIKKSSFHIRLDHYNFTELLHAHPLLVGLPPAALSLRFALLKYLNVHLANIIPLVDLRLIAEDWSLAFLVCGLRGHMFYETKMELLHDAVSRTKFHGRRAVVTLDRQDKELALFEQGFKQLNHLDPSRLKHMDKAWEVKLQKEGAQDAGGPYRETITQFCADIQSKELKLFIPCPNAKEEVGFNQDKFVPNPKATSPHHLAMFEFIGKLIGIAIRTKNCLDLSLPSFLWKPIVCIRTDRSDLEAVDKRCCQYLDAIANNGKNSPKLSPEAFNEYIFETFTTQASDGSIVELKPGGKSIPVTWDNRMEFCSLAEQLRLNEFKPQIEAIIRGISSIIPIQYLYLCTWQELELRVVGRDLVDLMLLRKHTRYCGVSPNERHVLMFWKVLETFTPEELTLFIRFVWGRSKLPSANEFYTAQFQLQSFSKEISRENPDPDDFLPEAQTCFFSLALPRYSSPEVMKQKLLYAITTCRDIDADFLVPDQGEDRGHEPDSDFE